MPEVQTVFAEYGDEYEASHPMTVQQKKALHKKAFNRKLNPLLKNNRQIAYGGKFGKDRKIILTKLIKKYCN